MQYAKNILVNQLQALFPDNNSGQITPQRLRDFFTNVLDSSHLKSELSVPTGTYVNVKDYGAKGDGIADDTNAFVTAITKGVEVFVPAGTYLLTSTLNIEKRLLGSGSDTILSFNGNSTLETCINLNGQIEQCSLKAVDLDANGQLIKITRANTSVNYVKFTSSGVNSISLNIGSGQPYANGTTISNSVFHNSHKAIVEDTNNDGRCTIYNCAFLDCALALDLGAMKVDVNHSFFDCRDILRIDENVPNVNPQMKFTSCYLNGSNDGIITELNNTTPMLVFTECIIPNLRIKQLIDTNPILLHFENSEINILNLSIVDVQQTTGVVNAGAVFFGCRMAKMPQLHTQDQINIQSYNNYILTGSPLRYVFTRDGLNF